MHSNWLYDQSALWITVCLMAAMMLAAEIAYWAGRRWHANTHDAGREVFVAIKVSLLGLLALLLAFTFSMAADRYADRQRLVTDEANTLHTLLLRSSLLPEPARARFQQLFGEFVDARLAFFDARQNLVAVEEAIDRTEKLHDQMWGLVETEARRDLPMGEAEGMIRSLNDEWSLHRQRVHAFENRVPDAVILLLFTGTIIAMAAVGFAAGIANHRGTVGKLLLAALLGGTILVVLDLDRPRRGLFQISQEPMLHLKQVLERPAVTGK
jgi:Protein of unknown function (DUF4239)